MLSEKFKNKYPLSLVCISWFQHEIPKDKRHCCAMGIIPDVVTRIYVVGNGKVTYVMKYW